MAKPTVQEVQFDSRVLGKPMKMLVYLPAAYDGATPLPVLYFLHGRSGDETILLELGMDSKAERMIRDGAMKPVIIVCPRIENSRGINSSLSCEKIAGSGAGDFMIHLGMYEDYFIEEIVPMVDSMFATIRDKQGRYVGGVSGGGYAALHNAFRHQDLFSKVGGHMPAIELSLEEEDRPFFKDASIWEKYDPISIAKNTRISSDFSVYLDAGDLDEGQFYKGCALLQEILDAKGIRCQNAVFPGHHNAAYLKSNLEKYLAFYGSPC